MQPLTRNLSSALKFPAELSLWTEHTLLNMGVMKSMETLVQTQRMAKATSKKPISDTSSDQRRAEANPWD